MKRVLIDMDGVLANFDKRLAEKCPDYDLYEEGSPERGNLIDDFCEGYPNIFLELEPMEGAIDAFETLCANYEVYILSTPMWKVPESFTDKRKWVERFLGKNAEKKLILSHNKGIVEGDYLIDDRIKHGVENFKGIHIHFGKVDGFRNWRQVIYFLGKADGWLN